MATDPKHVLTPDEYSNYRNIRAVSVLFVVFGSVMVFGGVILAFGENRSSQEKIHPAFAVGIAVAGLAGSIGGIAALRGSRRWAPLVYVMAAWYVLMFPVGTILSIVMLKGLSRYLASVERVRAQADCSAELGAAADGGA